MHTTLRLVAEKIINLRKSLNLTQEELAQKAQISLDELKKIESADPTAHIEEYAKIGTILKFTPGKIFADCEREHKRHLNHIKKMLQTAPIEFLMELETHIKNKLKTK